MSKLKDEILQKLHGYLLKKESIPVRDNANIITPDGINASIAVQTIKDCIKIIKRCNNEITS